eukprot:5424776-Amphidinium_carterae.1
MSISCTTAEPPHQLALRLHTCRLHHNASAHNAIATRSKCVNLKRSHCTHSLTHSLTAKVKRGAQAQAMIHKGKNRRT